MTAWELLRHVTDDLSHSGIDNPDIEARWLLEKFLETDFVKIVVDKDRVISSETQERISAAVANRKNGIPLAYVLGSAEFYGLPFLVNPTTLIPRPETEGLVDWALEYLKKNHTEPAQVKIADFGAGTGCIGIAIATKWKGAHITSLEKAAATFSILSENVRRHNLENRLKCIHATVEEFTTETREKFDLVVANPPYISVHDHEVDECVKMHEPHLALYSGETGLEAIASWAQGLPYVLSEKSAACFEIGHQQGPDAVRIFENLKIFDKVYTLNDISGKNRFVCGERLS